MSKRKVDPMAQAIRDLKYLERVVKALEVLCGERERVARLTARMGAPSPGSWFPPEMRKRIEEDADWRKNHEQGPPALDAAIRASDSRPRPGADHGNATLDTPERQEYEAAKREGRTVPDPFADPFRNATPEQRERMAEQRAAIAAEKARRGLPAKIAAVEALNGAGAISPEDVETVVSTEELATGANGSFGAAVSVTATDERLSPEESDG